MKKLDGCKTYSVILNEQELNICKRAILNIDIRNIDIVSNTSRLLRYLVRLGAYCTEEIMLDNEAKDLLREEN